MAGKDGADDTVEKLMSIRRDEFEAGLSRLDGILASANGPDGYILTDVGPDKQTLQCSFEPQPDVTLGTLLKLPRARVRLDLTPLSGEARHAFMTLFDRTFQRGGG